MLDKLRIQRERLRPLVRSMLLWFTASCVGAIIVAVLAQFFVKWAEEAGWYSSPSERAGHFMSAVGWFLTSAWFIVPTAFISGLTAGVWLDWLLRGLEKGQAVTVTVDKSCGGIRLARLNDAPVKYVQVRVEADVDLMECETTLKSVANADTGEIIWGEPVACTWSLVAEQSALVRRDIYAGIPADSNLFRVHPKREGGPHQDVIELQTRQRPNRLVDLIQTRGRFRLEIDVRARGARPIVRYFVFSWQSFDEMSLDPEDQRPDR